MSTTNQLATRIEDKIYSVRDQKVMLDYDLAEMYDIPTKVLKQAVRRNLERFPEDFMFEMSGMELSDWRSQNVTSKSLKMGLRYKPFCFTEHGVLMLSSVLRSSRAVEVNIQIMRVYSKIKELLFVNKELMQKMEKLEKETNSNTKEIQLIFSYIKKLIAQPSERTERIGFNKKW
ncbi:MAG: ORF6N domain-containing protein [Ginsengibacter sp.]